MVTVHAHPLCARPLVWHSFADEATEDGCDIQMQTNHLSHFLLTQICMPALDAAASLRGEARIVNHSSCARAINAAGASKSWTNDLKPAYLGKNGGQLGGNATGMMSGANYERYQQTKLANVVFTYALNERLRACVEESLHGAIGAPAGTEGHLASGPEGRRLAIWPSGIWPSARMAARGLLGARH